MLERPNLIDSSAVEVAVAARPIAAPALLNAPDVEAGAMLYRVVFIARGREYRINRAGNGAREWQLSRQWYGR